MQGMQLKKKKLSAISRDKRKITVETNETIAFCFVCCVTVTIAAGVRCQATLLSLSILMWNMSSSSSRLTKSSNQLCDRRNPMPSVCLSVFGTLARQAMLRWFMVRTRNWKKKRKLDTFVISHVNSVLEFNTEERKFTVFLSRHLICIEDWKMIDDEFPYRHTLRPYRSRRKCSLIPSGDHNYGNGDTQMQMRLTHLMMLCRVSIWWR